MEQEEALPSTAAKKTLVAHQFFFSYTRKDRLISSPFTENLNLTQHLIKTTISDKHSTEECPDIIFYCKFHY